MVHTRDSGLHGLHKNWRGVPVREGILWRYALLPRSIKELPSAAGRRAGRRSGWGPPRNALELLPPELLELRVHQIVRVSIQPVAMRIRCSAVRTGPKTLKNDGGTGSDNAECPLSTFLLPASRSASFRSIVHSEAALPSTGRVSTRAGRSNCRVETDALVRCVGRGCRAVARKGQKAARHELSRDRVLAVCGFSSGRRNRETFRARRRSKSRRST